MWNFLGFEQQTYTFFAPVNGAYQNIPGSVHDELQSASSSDSAKQTVNEMFLNHGGMLTIIFEMWCWSKRTYTQMMHWEAWHCFVISQIPHLIKSTQSGNDFMFWVCFRLHRHSHRKDFCF